MMKGKLFVIGIVLAWVVACTQTTNEKTELVARDISKVEITSNGAEGPRERNTKVLNRGEISRFADMWNSSQLTDDCKFYPEYEVHVFFKNGNQITFRMNDTSIQENKTECYRMDYKKLVKFIEE